MPINQQIADLVSNTSQLLDTVNVSRQSIDNAANLLATHESESDPHEQYVKEITNHQALYFNTDRNIVNDQGDKIYGGVYHVASGGGEQEIMQAQEWIRSRFSSGTITLDPNGTYTITDTINLETGIVGIDGRRAKFNCSTLGLDKVAILANNTTNDVSQGGEQFPHDSFINDLRINGRVGVNGRNFQATAIRLNTDVVSSSVRMNLNRVHIDGFGTGVSIGSRAYFTRGFGLSVKTCGTALLFESGVLDFSENVAFYGGQFYNSDCIVKSLAGHRFSMYGVSLDYHGDKFGSRITPNDRILDLRAGTMAELYGCHIEFEYGHHAGQNLEPINLVGANTKLIMIGGFLGTPRNTRQPNYSAPIKSDNSSQEIIIRDVRLLNLGRNNQPTLNDELVSGSTADGNGVIGHIVTSNLMSHEFALKDFPTAVSMTNTPGGNNQRNGIDDPFGELSKRTVVSGGVTISRATSPDSGVSSRNNLGSMMKITATAAGKAVISLPVLDPSRRRVWGFFINASQATGGNITVRQRDSTVVQRWDGNSGITVAADTRNSYSNTTKTITVGGANQFELVSWKDTHSNPIWSTRMSNDFIAVEIDFPTGVTGSIYLDDAFDSMM